MAKSLTVLFLAESFREIIGWPYVSPGSDDKNGIDCSGAFVRAYKAAGLSIYHGSNRIERSYCHDCFDISGNTNRLEPGMAVFKYREPGEEYYKLPDSYQPGGKNYDGDIRDYYHIGLVESVSPLKIIHATTPNAKRDTSIGKWRRAGYLDAVKDYGSKAPADNDPNNEGGTQMALYDAKVLGDGWLNLRSAPRKGGTDIGDIPQGSYVQVLEETNDEWSKVFYEGQSGYVMREYLERIEDKEEVSEEEFEPAGGGKVCVVFYFDNEEEANVFRKACRNGKVEKR